MRIQDERPSDGSSRPLEEITPARLGIGALLSSLHDACSWRNLPAPTRSYIAASEVVDQLDYPRG